MTTGLLSIEMLTEQLEKIRSQLGDEAYEQARRGFAKSVILKENGEKFIANAFPDMDVEALRKEVEAEGASNPHPAGSPEAMLMEMMRKQVPNIRTQAHFNTFMACFDALRTCLNAYFGRDRTMGDKAREALNKALDMAARMPEMEDQLAQMPDGAKSDAAKAFTTEPKEFHEYDRQRKLMVELVGIADKAKLEQWYAANRQTMDDIVDQRLRNELFDAIRDKRKELGN